MRLSHDLNPGTNELSFYKINPHSNIPLSLQFPSILDKCTNVFDGFRNAIIEYNAIQLQSETTNIFAYTNIQSETTNIFVYTNIQKIYRILCNRTNI